MAKRIDWSDLLITGYSDIKNMLTDLYVNQNLGLEAVGNILGIHKDPLRKMLGKLQIPLKPKGRPGPKNIRIEKAQRKSKPRDFESAMKQEASRLGMRPDDYVPIETRKLENTDCPRYESCLLYCAILHGWVVPCSDCNGKPEYYESMERTNQVFQQEYGKSLPEIPTRSPGVEKEEKEEPHQFHKYLEGIYFYGEKTK